MPKPKKDMGYTKAMDELEAIIGEIESEGIDVDVLTDKVQRASELIGFLRGKLRDTEGEVRKVLKGLEHEVEEAEEEELVDEEEDEGGEDGALF